MALDQRLAPVLDELAELIARGQLILLVGAGLSKWAGLPTWKELVCELARDLVPDLRRAVPDAGVRFEAPRLDAVLSVDRFLEIAEVHRRVCGPARLVGRLREMFDTSRVDASALPPHRVLVRLADFVPALYTTNFDDLLERAFAAAGRPFQAVAEPGDLQRWQYDRIGGRWVARYPIYKLHGSLDRPGTLVLAETDFHRRIDLAANAIDLRFCSDVVGRALLLVGYGFSDPNLRWIWTKLHDLDVMPRAYSIEVGESSDLEIAYYQRGRISRVDLRAADPARPVELVEFLEALLERSRRECTPRS
jgi:hypothetical protein